MDMSKILEINKRDNWSLWLLGWRIIECCDHYLISFSRERLPDYDAGHRIFWERITMDNLTECRHSPYSLKQMEYYLKNEPSEGFLFFDADTNDAVGCMWIMYRGGNELQYRVRNVDAFGFDFCVFPQFRGKGYFQCFLHSVMAYLNDKQIHTLYASVRRNNYNAIRAYEKSGMQIITRKVFFRVHNFRFPYPVV